MANNSSLHKKEILSRARLYCVSTPPKESETYAGIFEAALKGGADILQLRDKRLTARELIKLGRDLAALCHRYGALFIVNDRVDVALAANADGVHLGQEDLPIVEAQRIAKNLLRGTKREFLMGCSTHSLAQAEKAALDGADYVGCGPVFATPTKSGKAPVGLELVRAYKAQLKIPFVAIGGIDLSNLSQVTAAGAHCVAVVRAAFDQSDIESSVRQLKTQINSLVPA